MFWFCAEAERNYNARESANCYIEEVVVAYEKSGWTRLVRANVAPSVSTICKNILRKQVFHSRQGVSKLFISAEKGIDVHCSRK